MYAAYFVGSIPAVGVDLVQFCSGAVSGSTGAATANDPVPAPISTGMDENCASLPTEAFASKLHGAVNPKCRLII